MCESYRELVDIYDEQGILDARFAPGEARIEGDAELIARIDRLRTDIIKSGQKVKKALDDLSEYIDNNAATLAQGYSEKLLATYRQVMPGQVMPEAYDFRHFMASLGELLVNISDFHYRLSELYGADQAPTCPRSKQIGTIVNRLQAHVEDPAGPVIIQ
jgi:hypothetical protein